jgi:broad specificity phosphatase PhoE
MDELIAARHGESEYSAVGRVNGDPSVHVDLTDAGRAEALALGEVLSGDDIDLCVTSEFLRVQRTADLALGDRTVPRVVLADLNDVDAGDFEGGGLEAMRAWLRDAGPAATPPGGREPRVDCVRRYARALRWIVDRPERTILAVSHGLFVTYTVRAAAGESLPITLKGIQASHAHPHRLSRADVLRAAERLEAYADDPERSAEATFR